jgi:hypothetical protein
MVLKCHPRCGANGIAADLSNGEFLMKDNLLKITERYFKRGKKVVWERQPESGLYPMSRCKLDDTLNGQFGNQSTLANGIKDLYASMKDLAQNFESVLNNDNDASNVIEPSSNRQESPNRTTPDSPNDVEATQTLRSASSSDMVAPDRPKQDWKPNNDENTAGTVSSCKSSIVGSPLKSAPVIPTSLPVAKLAKKGGQKRVREAVASDLHKENKHRRPKQRATVQRAPDWKPTLDRLLAGCTAARKKRRADYAKIETCETALIVAIDIRRRLDEMDAPVIDRELPTTYCADRSQEWNYEEF